MAALSPQKASVSPAAPRKHSSGTVAASRAARCLLSSSSGMREERRHHTSLVACAGVAEAGDAAVPLAAASEVHLHAPVQPRTAAAAAGQDDAHHNSEEIDVLGIGQLMIDYSAAVDDSLLAALDVPKGGRRVISVEERATVMERLQGFDSQVSAGGSLANSLVGIAQLAAARTRALEMATAAGASSSTSASQLRRRGIRVAMAGCLGGSDALGEYGRAQMAAAGVDMLSLDDEASGSITTTTAAATTTGTVMVFTTPDAQRSFLSSFSSEDSVAATPALLAAVARARLVVLEGYLWELPGAAEAIPAIVAHARSVGTLTVLTAGDASVVARHGAKVLSAFQAGVEMFVCNAAEAQELVGHLAATQQQQQTCDMTALQEVQLDPEGSASMDDDRSSSSSSDTAEQHGLSPPVLGTGAADCGSDVSSSEGQGAACSLARVCPMVVVTDGSRGSYVTALGQLIVVPPFWRSLPPVDTCGAGDAYAAGLLHAFLLGQDLHAMGHAASKTASAVISRHGPQLLPGDADYVVAAGTGSSKTSSLAARFLAAAEGSVQQKAVQQQQAPAPQQAAAGEA